MTEILLREKYNTAPDILTPRLLMRAHRASDFDAVATMWADDDVVRHITGKPSTPTESWARLIRYIGHWPALGFGGWALEDRQTGAYLGAVGFADYKRIITPSISGIPEAGWVLAPHAHGRGLAHEALSASLQWADRHFVEDRIVAIISPEHERSIRLAEKCGFVAMGNAMLADDPVLLMERRRAPR
ncbi:GNAT family N-acetyltransferase [Agrobacterium sp. ES01]|uniref:GNAT family N-acetyltransferase n=1 Tax=Agrobacterium sp. ES01 TaxID=3420714 RepID=UPI003D09BA53